MRISKTMLISVFMLVAFAAVVIAASGFVPALATGAEGITTFSGSNSGPIVTVKNSGSGSAVRAQSAGTAVTGTSTKANGVVGQVSATPNPAPSAVVALAGVLGQDLASGGSNAGVVGTSVTDIGVLGTTMKSGTGVWGKVGNGTGVFGESANGFGVSGEVTTLSTHGAGVLGVGLSGGRGVIGTVGSANAFIVPATPAAGVDGIAGYGGNGVRAESFATPLPLPTAIGAAYQNAALAVLSASGGNIPLIVARTNTSDKMSLDSNGNMILAGTLTTKGTPLIVHRTTDGSSIGTYTSEQSLPSIEDFGKARLVSGQAYVYIDAAFASTIDPRADYLVFITPEGDSRGLYVTDKSMRGFVVRENQGGRSTLAFDYRIVAKPADSTERRLPLIKASLLGSGTLPQVVQIRGHMLVP